MYLIAENLVNVWDVIKDEFKKTKTLKDKRRLIAMMYQSWKLCDDTFTESRWSAANKDHPTGKTHLTHSGCQVLVL